MAGKCKSRSGRFDVEGFSYFDQATREDVGLMEIPKPEVAPVLDLWAPLSPPPPVRDGRASGRTRRRRGVRLSLEHNDSNPPAPRAPKPVSSPRARFWPDGSAAYFPGIQAFSLNPRERETPPRGLRGKVLSLSEQARRRIQRFLDTVRRDAPAYSMCLTCPGKWSPEWNAHAKGFFITLCKRMTASRDPIVSKCGFFWKQELQSRAAIHFHFLIWGLLPDEASHLQRWIAEQWNALVCARFHPKDAASHLAWHLHDTNFFEIRNFRYFTKYAGKDSKAVLAQDPIPGRWWGKFNAHNIPLSDKVEVELTPSEVIRAQRIARKLRQKAADSAKHAAMMREASLVRLSGEGRGQPVYSEFWLQCSPQRRLIREFLRFSGLRPGRFRFPPEFRITETAVFLSGPNPPETARRILEYVRTRDEADFGCVPF